MEFFAVVADGEGAAAGVCKCCTAVRAVHVQQQRHAGKVGVSKHTLKEIVHRRAQRETDIAHQTDDISTVLAGCEYTPRLHISHAY